MGCLQAQVDEIVVDGNPATMKGSCGMLTNAIAQIKKGTSKEVPNFINVFLVRPERFERPTPWFVAKYSIQLSYGRA